MQEWIKRYQKCMEGIAPFYSPCVIPPVDWISPLEGGYHVPAVSKTLDLVKCRTSHMQRLTYEQMPEVYDCVNSLQKVAWTINDKILNTIEQCIRLNLPLALPEREPIEIPPCPIPEKYEALRGEMLKNVLSPA
jgi:DNA-directed RNA polymerase